MPTVYIIIYSLYHHVYKIAKSVQKGLEEEGVTVKLFQVPETLSEDVLTKLHAPPKPDIPVITVGDLVNADAFIFGVPTRFGTLPSQMKSFLDATGALWATGGLAGKFVGTFFSTASQHGGQETTAYTLLTYFAHHGLNYIPLGFANAHLFDNSEVVGGSAYGAGAIANGDGSREPTEKELDIGITQGENFARLLKTYHRGLELDDDEDDNSDVAPITAANNDNTNLNTTTTDTITDTTTPTTNTTVTTTTNTTDVAPKNTDIVPATTTNETDKDKGITPATGVAGAAAVATAGGIAASSLSNKDSITNAEPAKGADSITEIQPVKDNITTTPAVDTTTTNTTTSAAKPAVVSETPAVPNKEDETLKKKEEVKEKSVEPAKPKPAPAAAPKPTPVAKKEEKSKCFCM